MVFVLSEKRENNFENLKNYLENNQVDINKKNEKGWTALMLAARNSKPFLQKGQ